MNTPTADNASEDDITASREKDQFTEGKHAGGTGSGRKTADTAEITKETRLGSLMDGPEEKIRNAVTNQKRIVPKKSKKGEKAHKRITLFCFRIYL